MHIPQLSRRFFAMLFSGMLFSLPFFVIVNQSVTTLNAQIEFARKEQIGVLFHKDLLDLFQSLQELRGFASLKPSGDKSAAAEIASRKKDLLQSLATIENENKETIRILGVNQHWQALRGLLVSLLSEKKQAAASGSFDIYFRCIDALLMAILGKMRSMTTELLVAGASRETEKQFLDFKILDRRLEDVDRDILTFLELAHGYNQKYAQPLTDHQDVIKPQLD